MSEIAHTTTGTKGRYSFRIEGDEAELTCSIASPVLTIEDHTCVRDALYGTGAGLKLAQPLVDVARANGAKIIVLCPFVRAQSKTHPDWADAIQ